MLKLSRCVRLHRIWLLILFAWSPGLLAFTMEAREIDVDKTNNGQTTFQSITFQNSFSVPPVVFAITDENDKDPSTLRIRNVTVSGFEIAQVEPPGEDGEHKKDAKNVHFLAIEPGVHVLGGHTVEVGLLSSNAVVCNFSGCTASWDTHGFATPFPNTPIVLAQIQTMTNEQGAPPGDPSWPWLTTAVRNISTTSFQFALERSEVDDGGLVSGGEAVAYLAIEAGISGTFDTGDTSIEFETILTGNVVDGWSNGCNDVNFQTVDSNKRLVIATKATRRGNNGGWLRRCDLKDNRVGLTIDEDRDRDSERSHIAEAASILVLSEDFSLATCGPIPAQFPLSAGDEIDIKSGVFVNGNEVLPTGKQEPNAIVDSSGARGSFSQTLPVLNPPAFPGNGSSTDVTDPPSPLVSTNETYYRKIKITNGQSASFTGGGIFHIDELELEKNTTIDLGAGTYFIDTIDTKGDDVTINVTGQPVILHIGDKFDADKKRLRINSGGDVVGLRVFLHEDAEFKGGEDLEFTGLLYGPNAKKVELKKRTAFHGPIVVAGDIKVEDDSAITYGVADQTAVSLLTSCVSETIDHYSFEHDGNGVTCDSEQITIRAHDLNHNRFAPTSGTTLNLAVSTMLGDWVTVIDGSGSLVDATRGDGLATYSFPGGEDGVTLAFNYTVLSSGSSETFDFDTTDGAFTETTGSADASEDPNMTFANSGFRFTNDTDGNTSIPTQIAGKFSDLNPGAKVIRVQAIRTDTTTGECAGVFGDGDVVDVELASQCINPVACAGKVVSVTNNGVTTAIASNPAAGVASYASAPLLFGPDSKADLAFVYPDAGAVQLHARFGILLDDGAPSGDTMLGASNAFVTRPFGFDVDFSNDRAVNGTTGPSYAADANGSAFVKGAEDFYTTVAAVAWQAVDDADGNGVPDANADLSDNALTPNFGQEIGPATVDVAHTLVAPAGGNAGTLSGGSNVGGFAGGATAPALAWDEIGIIDLSASHTDYLGSGANVSGWAANVGRFYPARLAVSDNAPTFRHGPDAAWTCTFTYMDQPFTFATDPLITVTALNADGAITMNYGGNATADDFWKFDGAPFLAGRSYADTSGSSSNLDAPAAGVVNLTAAVDFDGSGTLSISGDMFSYERNTSPEAPFASEATLSLPAAGLVDGDGVCYHSAAGTCNVNDGDSGESYAIPNIAGTTLRFGRLVVDNGFGSEVANLRVPARAEYFDGVALIANTDDGCTGLNLANHIDLSNPPSGTQNGDQPMTIGASTTSVSSGDPLFLMGESAFVFTPPGPGNTGFVDIEGDLSSAAMDWLMFDWDGDGNHDNHPTARASFGIFHGARQIIYVREPWN